MGDCYSIINEEKDKPKRPRPPGSGRGGDTFPSTTGAGTSIVGSQVYLYKQDPGLHYVGHRVAWIPVDIRHGPLTDDVIIVGMKQTYRPTDTSGNYLYSPRTDPDAFDAVNTLCIIQHVLWMYRRVVRKVKGRSVNWLWGNRPIQAYPYAGEDSNAYYSRGEKALKFYFFSDGVKTIYACRSWDIVAHEAGHAVLDSLQPGWITSSNPQTGALHEAFGDLTSIFSVLDQLDMCELIVAHTKGNLGSRHNFLAALGEEFGRGVGRYFGIRNADEDLTISKSSEEVHELSKVFTGAIYDVLVRIFTATLHLAEYPPAETLYRAGRHLFSVFVLSVIEAPYKNATFEDVASLMIKKEPQEVFKNYLRLEFTRREVFNEWARPKPHRAAMLADRTVHACATLRACGSKMPGIVGHTHPPSRSSSAKGSVGRRTPRQIHTLNNQKSSISSRNHHYPGAANGHQHHYANTMGPPVGNNNVWENHTSASFSDSVFDSTEI